MSELTVGTIVGKGISNGMRNTGSIAANAILWLLTIWIPYLNVGTTIGMTVGLVAKSGRGEPISPTEIFNPVYRKQMGEYFLVSGLVSVGTSVAFALLVIPGLVIAIAWSLAILLTVDRGMNPSAAISESNNLTYGHKWTIFWGTLVLSLVVGAIVGILFLIGGLISPTVGTILGLVGMVLSISIIICGSGFIYTTLVDGGPVAEE